MDRINSALATRSFVGLEIQLGAFQKLCIIKTLVLQNAMMTDVRKLLIIDVDG